jgi:hypothetical protein
MQAIEALSPTSGEFRISEQKEFRMHWLRVAVWTFLAILVVGPANASAQGAAPEPPRRFSVNLSAGSHFRDGGDSQAFSFGYTPWRGLTLMLGVERGHMPTRVSRFPNGFSATRNGTLTFISGEVRYAVPLGRVAPFGLVGRGAGWSRPNVNDIFPKPVKSLADVVYAGGGVYVLFHPALAVSIDARLELFMDRESLGMGARLPIRAGVAWRF